MRIPQGLLTERPARTAGSHPSRAERRWAVVRLTLGILQMTGAGVALGLLFAGGVTTFALAVVVVTGLMTTISVLLFGGRRAQPSDRNPRSRST